MPEQTNKIERRKHVRTNKQNTTQTIFSLRNMTFLDVCMVSLRLHGVTSFAWCHFIHKDYKTKVIFSLTYSNRGRKLYYSY